MEGDIFDSYHFGSHFFSIKNEENTTKAAVVDATFCQQKKTKIKVFVPRFFLSFFLLFYRSSPPKDV
jgi:hypothetical protein